MKGQNELSRAELDKSLSRPKLDATLVLDSCKEEETPKRPHTLFALASLNSKTAASAEVPWSQLLALSLKPDVEPVLSVGRHKDCHVQVNDQRVSVVHFDVVARRAGQAGLSGMEDLFYECFLHDRSSNGTAINGEVVGKGQSRPLRHGDEIAVLPAKRVGEEEMIAFLFRNTSEGLRSPRAAKSMAADLEELVLCPICMQPIYKCVALLPCSHNYCMACCSDWIHHKAECPLCRRRITAVMKNHPMDSVVETFLSAQPERRRSEQEQRDMDSRDKLRLGQSGKLVRDFCSIAAPRTVSPEAPRRRPQPQGVAPEEISARQFQANARHAQAPQARDRRDQRDARENAQGSQVCVLQ